MCTYLCKDLVTGYCLYLVKTSIDGYVKDGGPGRSGLDVVFTMILCATNFYLVSYEAHIHKLGSNSF